MNVRQTEVSELGRAHELLAPLLGLSIAPTLFAIALLCCGLNSTVTATMAGQIVMEGFLNFRMRPWLRRLVTRMIAIVPAVFVIGYFGEGRTTDLLVASQVILSMQLGFAVWPPITRQTGVTSDIDGDGATRKAHGRSWYYGFAKQYRLWRNKAVAFLHKMRQPK